MRGNRFYFLGYNMNSLSAGWHHLAAVANGGNTYFYVDGVYSQAAYATRHNRERTCIYGENAALRLHRAPVIWMI